MPPKAVHRSGWSVRGELRVSGTPQGAGTVESLAERFVLEARGKWKVAVAKPANAVGISMMAGGLESDFHEHRESQLMYLVKGELTCEASSSLWIVPPQSAIWIPSGVLHKVRARAPLEGYSLFVEPQLAEGMPTDCRAVSVSPLFRELLLRLAHRPASREVAAREQRLVGVLLDELAEAEVENHRLPMPRDPRLQRLVEALTAHPSARGTTRTWAKRLGIGERTLHRLLVRETGLGFVRWRQQLHVTLALRALARGASVQSVAAELGYEGASSFVTMFKKVLGSSPARYMARRLGSPA